MKSRGERPEARVTGSGLSDRPSWERFTIAFLAVFLAFFFVIGASIYFMLTDMHAAIPGGETPGKEGTTIEVDERINILLLGVDSQRPYNGTYIASRSDTMILASVDPLSKEIGALSLPRDTRVPIPGRPRPEKLAHAFAYGGPEKAMAAVSGFLGVPVHYYVTMDYSGFVSIVDLLGGVEINVERNMDYEDPAQDLYIHLKAGRQVMDGNTALKYVRYRSDNDIARVGRQQQFINALLDKAFQMGTIFKLGSLMDTLRTTIKTNLDPGDMLKLALLGKEIPRDEIKFGMVPGKFGTVDGLSYWLPDMGETKEAVDRLIRGINPEENAGFTVEVLNANGRLGAAARMRELLAEMGYRIISVDNAEDQNRAETLVVDRTGDRTAGRLFVRNVALLLDEGANPLYKTERKRREPARDGNQEEPADYTIYLGQDFVY